MMTEKTEEFEEKLEIVKHQFSEVSLCNDTEEDYTFVRDHIKRLIEKAESAMDNCSSLAADTEHPRVFEVLGGLINTIGTLTQQLMDLQKKRKDIHGGSGGGSKNTQNIENAIFVGTTEELQKVIRGEISSDA